MARKHSLDDNNDNGYYAKSPKFSDLKLDDDEILNLEIFKILNDTFMTNFEKSVSVKIALLNHSIKRKNKCFSNDLRKRTMHNYLCKSLFDFATHFDGEINDQIIEDLGL